MTGADETTSQAETMRRAANLMRERAKAATEGPWKQDDDFPGDVIAIRMGDEDEDNSEIVVRDRMLNSDDAVYIASWHTDVALAVAEWLEHAASLTDSRVFPQSDPVMEGYPLTVARTYLGETAATTGEAP